MSTTTTNLLFFSKQGEASSNFMQMLHKYNYLSKFKTICIDMSNNKQYDDMITQMIQRNNITEVPAIIFNNNGKLVFKQGAEAFKWLEGIIYITQQNANAANMMAQQRKQQTGPGGFRDVEMAGVSDNYAYTQTDEAQPKSFMKYGDDEQNGIYTAPNDNKLNDRDLKSRMSDINKLRRDQESTLKDQMKRQQIEAVIAAEQDRYKISNS